MSTENNEERTAEAPADGGPRLSTRKKWIFRLIAAGIPLILGAIVTLVLIWTGTISLGDRYYYLQEPGHEVTGHKYIHDPLLGWRNIPNWKATTHGRKLTINSKGLRDREYTYEKPPGVVRILVLGDSYAWGYGVADDEIFTEVLEERLEKGPGRYEVLNTGVSGWGTDQEYLFMLNEGFKYAPDIVVLAFFLPNDPENNVVSRQYGLDKPVFLNLVLELGNVPVPKPKSGVKPRRLFADAHPLDLTVAIIAKMSEACAKQNCKLVIMRFGQFLIPEKIPEKELGVDAELFDKKLGVEIDAPYLNLDAAFADREIPTQKLLEGNDGWHWNAYGHRVTAEVLHSFLAKKNLVRR